jgi:hypothetical protein
VTHVSLRQNRAVRHIGAVTRGTTNPNRLRRVDNYIAYRCRDLLADAVAPLVVDLGYGAHAGHDRRAAEPSRAAVRADVAVVGLEIDPVRVAEAQPRPLPRAAFRSGGFELAGYAR